MANTKSPAHPKSAGMKRFASRRGRGGGCARGAGAGDLRYARFFQSAPIGIASVDGDGRIGSSNTAFAHMFDYVEGRVDGEEALTPDLADAEWQAWDEDEEDWDEEDYDDDEEVDFATYDKLNAAHAAKKRTKAAQLPAKAVSIEPVATTTTATTTTNGDGDSDGQLWLRALVGEPNGQRVLRAEQQGSAEHPETLGIAVAEQLLKQGAGDILAAVYGDSAQ
mgnify:CR=1 FL=1